MTQIDTTHTTRTSARSTLLALAIAVIAFALPAMAAGRMPAGPFGPGGFGPGGFGHGELTGADRSAMAERLVEHLEEILDLSESQSDDLRSLVGDHQTENEARWLEMSAANTALHAAMTAETFDESAVRTAFREASAAREEITVSHAALLAEARTILTPEQAAQLAEMHADGGIGHPRRPMRRFHGEGGHGGHHGDAPSQ